MICSATSSKLHRNAESVGQGQELGIRSILVSICSAACDRSCWVGFGCREVNSPCGEQKRQSTLAEMQSWNSPAIAWWWFSCLLAKHSSAVICRYLFIEISKQWPADRKSILGLDVYYPAVPMLHQEPPLVLEAMSSSDGSLWVWTLKMCSLPSKNDKNPDDIRLFSQILESLSTTASIKPCFLHAFTLICCISLHTSFNFLGMSFFLLKQHYVEIATPLS